MARTRGPQTPEDRRGARLLLRALLGRPPRVRRGRTRAGEALPRGRARAAGFARACSHARAWGHALILGLALGGGLVLAACENDLSKALDDLSGKPSAHASSQAASTPPLPIPAGPHLYCLTNIGHSLVLYDLAADQARPDLQRYVDLDPVGPWFYGGRGYYLGRVDTSGRGSNALIEFDPRTAQETRRLGLGVNTNPNNLLILPGAGGVAWIALRGSTFNAPYGPDGIGVVNLGTMTGRVIRFTELAGVPNAGALHSLISFAWDAACPARGGQPCVYALVNGFDGALHPGTLLVLAPDATGQPVWLDSIALGGPGGVPNPLEDMLLDAPRQRLWIVNNGGYAPPPPSPGAPTGALQVLDTTAFHDGIAGNETVLTIPAGFAPTGVFGFDAGTAWVTTYPSDRVQTVDLASGALNAAPGLPALTGGMLHSALAGPQLFAGAGGFGSASLARLDPTDGHLLAQTPLQAGNGPVSCAEFTTP